MRKIQEKSEIPCHYSHILQEIKCYLRFTYSEISFIFFEHTVLRIGYTKVAFLCSSLNHAGAVAVCITQTIHSWQGIDCLSQI